MPTEQHTPSAMPRTEIDGLTELIARLEKASGPDRSLGHDVLLACGWRRTCVGHFYGPLWHWSSPDGKRSWPEDSLPCPTASIDAALQLVPEGWVCSRVDNRRRYGDWLVKLRAIDEEQTIHVAHKSLRIALCIAVLKCRTCGRKLKSLAGLCQHNRDKHGER